VLDWILDHGEQVGVVTVILVVALGFAHAWATERLFLGKTVRRMLEEKDIDRERETERADKAEARSERLLSQLERVAGIAEEVTAVAKVTSIREGKERRRT
jgi:hypothetical protein